MKKNKGYSVLFSLALSSFVMGLGLGALLSERVTPQKNSQCEFTVSHCVLDSVENIGDKSVITVSSVSPTLKVKK